VECFRIRSNQAWQKLERNLQSQPFIFGQPDDAHSTPPKFPDEPEATEHEAARLLVSDRFGGI
jgi:hypothetical protein